MITYPVTLPCPKVSGHRVNAANVIKASSFEYGGEQEYISNDTKKFNFSITCNQVELEIFKSFFVSLYDGISPFIADWIILGNVDNKNIRFTSGYSLVSLGNSVYEITANCEVL